MSQWTETNTTNRRAGRCEVCGATIEAGAGLLIWRYGESNFDDEDNSAHTPPKIWSVWCIDSAACERHAQLTTARLRQRALQERLDNLAYGDWDESERQSVRAELQLKIEELTKTINK